MANLTAVRPIKRDAPQQSFPEAASQTFQQGEAVYLDANGRVAEFTATADDGTQRFIGFAAEDGHNNATAGGSSVTVWLNHPDTVFEGNITAAGSNQASAITQVGTLYPLYNNTADSITQIDISNTGGQIDCARITKVDGRTAVGETNARAEFQIIGSASQFYDPVD